MQCSSVVFARLVQPMKWNTITERSSVVVDLEVGQDEGETEIWTTVANSGTQPQTAGSCLRYAN